jgi:hypothetical protein
MACRNFASLRDPMKCWRITPGFEMIVEYGSNQQVCRFELPAVAPPPTQTGSGTPQRVDAALLELVPLSMRGKELGTLVDHAGRASIKITEYENISIGESQDPDRPGQRTGVAVVFKRDDCRGH